MLYQGYFTGSMPLLTPKTVLGHVVIPRFSLLPQLSLNMVKNWLERIGTLYHEVPLGAGEDRNAISRSSIRSWR